MDINREMKHGGWLILIPIIALILALMYFGTDAFHDHRSREFNPSEKDILKVAHQAVLEKLKAPRTAVFNPDREYVDRGIHDGGAYDWRAVVVVDSQNSFGALIRSTFHVKVSRSGETLLASTVEETN